MNKTWLIAASAALTLAAGNGSAHAAGASVTTTDSIQYSNNGQTVTFLASMMIRS